MKKWLFLLFIGASMFFAKQSLADVAITGSAPIFEQHTAFTGSFNTNSFSVTSTRTYLFIFSGAVWQTNDILTVPTGTAIAWRNKIPVDSSLTVGDTAMYIGTATTTNPTENIRLNESSVGFFHYVDVKVYEITNYNGTGATGSATSNTGGGPAPSLTFTPSSTGSLLVESASNDAHPLTAQGGWILLYATSTDAQIMDGYMATTTTSTASRVIAPGNSGGTNGFSMEVLEFLNLASNPTSTPQTFALQILKPLIIFKTLIIR